MSVLSKKSIEDALGIPSIEQLQQAMATISDNELNEEVDGYDEADDFPLMEEPSADEIKHALATAKDMRRQLIEIPDVSEKEEQIDEIADSAAGYFEDIMDKAFNAEDRFASELFNAANALLKTALDGKNSIINAKLKLLELELKRQKLEHEISKVNNQPAVKEVQGQTYTVANRNSLLKNR